MRVVLTGGGTGGHIYPALSVARCLAGDELLYVGSAGGPEARIVPEAGIPFRSLPARKLGRRPSLAGAGAALVTGWGVLRGTALLLSWRPDVVLGTGGYASAGVMLAAALLRIPSVVHEANLVPGRVNRLLARLRTRVAITYPGSQAYFRPGQATLTGLPVREELLTADPARARREYSLRADLPTLLVCGGSGGARTLNLAVLAALPELLNLGVQIVHQTGKAHYEGVISSLGDPPERYRAAAYVDDMPALLAAADLVVCRGGSSTLAELTAVGRPAIVVPYPFAVADHQTGNARALAEAGAAVVVRDSELTGERLAAEVSALLGSRARLEGMRAASRGLGRPDAARRVAELLREVGGRNGRSAGSRAGIRPAA